LLYAIEQDDSAEIPEPLRRADAVLVGDANGVIGGMGYSRLSLKEAHPVLGTFFDRFPAAVFVAARDRVFAMSPSKAAQMSLCVAAAAADIRRG